MRLGSQTEIRAGIYKSFALAFVCLLVQLQKHSKKSGKEAVYGGQLKNIRPKNILRQKYPIAKKYPKTQNI